MVEKLHNQNQNVVLGQYSEEQMAAIEDEWNKFHGLGKGVGSNPPGTVIFGKSDDELKRLGIQTPEYPVVLSKRPIDNGSYSTRNRNRTKNTIA